MPPQIPCAPLPSPNVLLFADFLAELAQILPGDETSENIATE